MTLDEVKQLRNGDEVYWNDPDEGLCSRHYIIQTIEIIGKDIKQLAEEVECVIRITSIDGDEIECLVRELE